LTVGMLVNKAPFSGKLVAWTFTLIQIVPLYVLFFSLGTKEAKKHFGLICPQCGIATSKAGNFLFTQAVCKKCNVKW